MNKYIKAIYFFKKGSFFIDCESVFENLVEKSKND
jgi:hypothetical protein